MTTLQRRLKKLEAVSAPLGPVRLLVRYVGCDGLDADEPKQDLNENDPNVVVVTVEYVDRPSKAPPLPTRSSRSTAAMSGGLAG